METSLENTKRQLSAKYLGRAGIHGIGLSQARNAVRVHVSPGTAQDAAGSSVLDALKRDAAPYDVLVTVEDRAGLL
jgi:hypothetical protein